MLYDVLILGGGPAGLTAGIYATRGGLKTAVVYTEQGGQAALSALIENFSGAEPVDGFTLTERMRDQAISFGAEMINATAVRVALKGKQKSITLDNGVKLSGRSLIIASGAGKRTLGLKREKELTGKGISYCAACDGRFFRKKPVAIVGGGDTAVGDALLLERTASAVYLIHRSQEFKASHILVDRLKESGVKIILDTEVTELLGDPLEGVKTVNKVTGKKGEIKVSGLFIAAGSVPNTTIKGMDVELSNGHILTDERMRTSVQGVFAAGDVRKTPLRQVITACADGAVAAASAIEFLK